MRFFQGVGVRDDMGCIEQFFVPKAAECTLPPICVKHPLPKCSLMQAYPHLSGHIRPSCRIGGGINVGLGVGGRSQINVLSVVHSD
jgi:hypothetical protein